MDNTNTRHALANHLDAMSNPWTDILSPKFITDICGHDQVRTISNACMESGRLPCMLFYGPPGTGKTCTARAIVRSLSKFHTPSSFRGGDFEYTKTMASVSLLEINASDKRTFGDVVNTIGRKYIPSTSSDINLTVVLVDEADSMTEAGQRELGNLISKCEREWYNNNTRLSFIICCNNASKITSHLYSQCLCIEFLAPSASDICAWLSSRLEVLGWIVDGNSKKLLELVSSSGSAANGGIDLRHVVNLVQSSASSRLYSIMSRIEQNQEQVGDYRFINLFESDNTFTPGEKGTVSNAMEVDEKDGESPHIVIQHITSLITKQWNVIDSSDVGLLLRSICSPSSLQKHSHNLSTGVGQKALVPCLARALRSTSAYKNEIFASSRMEIATLRWFSKTSRLQDPPVNHIASWILSVVTANLGE